MFQVLKLYHVYDYDNGTFHSMLDQQNNVRQLKSYNKNDYQLVDIKFYLLL